MHPICIMQVHLWWYHQGCVDDKVANLDEGYFLLAKMRITACRTINANTNFEQENAGWLAKT